MSQKKKFDRKYLPIWNSLENQILSVVFPSGITLSNYLKSSGETRQYGLPSFQGRDTKLAMFFAKKGNFFACWIDIVPSCQKLGNSL